MTHQLYIYKPVQFGVITFRKKYFKGGIEQRPKAEVTGHVILSRPEKSDTMRVVDKKRTSFLRRKASFGKYFLQNLNRNLI